jgi:hypothetical protein
MANFIANRMPHSALHRITLLQRFTGQKPDISFLHVFGCFSYIHVQNRTKFQPKARPLILVGYNDRSKAYRCFDHSSKKIIISRDVHFNEQIVGILSQKYLPSSDDDILRIFLHMNSTFFMDSNLSQPLPIPTLDSLLRISSNAEPSAISHHLLDSPTQIQPEVLGHNPSPASPSLPLPLWRSTRFRRQNVRLDDFILSVNPEDFNICTAFL